MALQSQAVLDRSAALWNPDLAPPSEAASVWLDALRGIAAIGVFSAHWRDCFFLDYTQLPHPNPAIAALYFVTGLGHQWVIVFFVLSGYLVGGSVLRQFSGGNWSWRDYLINRLSRLYAVLVPALLLGGAADLIGTHFFSHTGVYAAQHGIHLIGPGLAGRLTWRVLAGNYLFLQTILVPVFGTNGPLWSLSYEFWYYLAFPLLCLMVRRRQRTAGRILSAAALLCLLAFAGKAIALAGLIWMMGVALHALPAVKTKRRLLRAGAAVISLGALLACLRWCKAAQSESSDFVLGIAVTGLIWCVLWAARSAPRGWARRCIRRSAESSYTLYLIHVPVLLLLTAWISQQRWVPTLSALGWGAGPLLAVYLYAQLVYEMFEKRTGLLRTWLRRHVPAPGRRSADRAFRRRLS